MSDTRPRLRIQLFPRAETAVRAGHPWVYDSGIKSINREGDAGELAVVYDRRDRFLAIGLYDPASPIRLRVLQVGKPATIDRVWWLARARDADELRAPIRETDTDGYRCINGDSEGFPGLVADRYADTLVVKLYSPVWLPRWEEIESVLREVFSPRFLVLRLSRNLTDPASAVGIHEGFLGDRGDDVVVFRENGIRFESAVLHGQKTGFFLDQRDNRRRVEQLAAGRDVLNVFSFSGGFSLYAARGGARHVTDLDISAHALEAAERNFRLNDEDPRISSVRRDRIQADAFRWLDEDERTYDLIVVDPPSLAKREKERAGALRAYHALNQRAIAKLRRGGILVAASCSAHVSAQEFLGTLREIARQSGRPWRELWESAHAVDHPARFPEAGYLKALCVEFG